jgi:hypothetical protein
MTETVVEARTVTKADQWREWIAEQERSGWSARRFCKERGLSEGSFYAWRKRLRGQELPVRFALVEGGPQRPAPAVEAPLELVLATGERLRIGAGVDARTFRTVLEALRA